MVPRFRLSGFLVLVFVLGVQVGLVAQGKGSGWHPEQGTLPIRNFSTTDLGFDANNYSILRDQRGVLFVANVDGVLEWIEKDFWLVHSTAPGNPFMGEPVFSLSQMPDGTLVFGSVEKFGRIRTTLAGPLKLEDLSDRLPEEKRPHAWIDEIVVIGKVAWFKGDYSLYSWDGRDVEAISAPGKISFIGKMHGRLYALVVGVGLMRIEDGRLQPVPGTGVLGLETENVSVMLPAAGNGMLLHARGMGWLSYENGKLQPAWTAAIRRQLPTEPTCAVTLADGTHVLGTSRDGIHFISPDGATLMVVDESSGLRDNAVQALHVDEEQNLWAALDNGIACLDLAVATTQFDRISGLNGRITSITRFQGEVYVNSTQGTYRLGSPFIGNRSTHYRRGRFQILATTLSSGYDLLDCGNELLIANSRGLYAFNGKSIRSVIRGNTRKLFPVDPHRDSVLVTSAKGMIMLVRDGSSWSKRQLFPMLDSVMVLGIVRAVDGKIWLSTWERGIYRIETNGGLHHDGLHQFPLDSAQAVQPAAMLYPYGRTLLAVTNERNYVVDPASGRLASDSSFLKRLGLSPTSRVARTLDIHGRGNFLEILGDQRWYAIEENASGGKATLRTLPFLQRQIVNAFLAEPDGVCWFGTEENLYRHDLNATQYVPPPTIVLIRSVYNADTVWYRGNQPSERVQLTVPFSNAGVSILFTGMQLKDPKLVRYRWKLIGERDEWSEWSEKTAAEFPGLMEGSYAFVVEGRGAYGDTLAPAMIRIRVTPPTLRTWWAYALYLLGASALFVLALRFRTRRLEQRGRELEATIQDRTVEIRQQAEKIQSQAEELETLDAIVRTVNKEVRLTDVLSALLQQTLLLFPYVSTAFYLQRSGDDGMFRLVATVGEPAEAISSRAFTLSEIMDDPSNSLQTIQDGVYVLRGLERAWSSSGAGSPSAMNSFMGMSDVQQGTVRGFLVLGSDRMHQFDANDLRKLLRLREHVSSAVAKALAIRELESKNDLLDTSNRQLREMQQQLIVHEKLAALGELTAGIAHEIQNPLNFVNNFSSLSLELLDELEEDLNAMAQEDHTPLLGLVSTVRSNCERIREHGMRATSIVRAMLMHTRKGGGRRETVSLNEFLDQFVMLSYHGMRMLHPEHDLRLQTEYDRGIVGVKLLPQEMSRVIVNICNNAWEAAIEHADRETPSTDLPGENIPPAEAEDAGTRKPEVHVRSEAYGDRVRIVIRDNGNGIPEEMHGKIFEPFFTTKRSGNNAGLGLSMSYEIVTQLHQGTLGVRSEPGLYSEFIIDIPRDDTTRPE